MEKLNVIQRTDKPTDWMSSLVIEHKANGTLRICLDSKPLNKAPRRTQYQIPTLDGILSGIAKAFSVAEVNGYWHVPLDDESQPLTTFVTPFGAYSWKRMPFGLTVASEIFQKRLHDAIADLPGTFNCN